MALAILHGVENFKRALSPGSSDGSTPPPSMVVSGSQPSSIPDLEPLDPRPPTPMPEPRPLPPNWELGYPPGRKNRPASEMEGEESPLPRNWSIGYPPGRKPPIEAPEKPDEEASGDDEPADS